MCDSRPTVQAINGESSVEKIAGVDVSKLLECDGYSEGCKTAREGGSGRATGTRLYEPITVRKEVDVVVAAADEGADDQRAVRSRVPVLPPEQGQRQARALLHRHHHRRPRRRHQALVARGSQRRRQTASDVSGAGKPPQELVSFMFAKIRWTHEVGKTEHQDNWQEQL